MPERIFSASEKLKAVERELGYRKHVYARRIAERKMTQMKADEEIAVMSAIADDYREKAAGERLL